MVPDAQMEQDLEKVFIMLFVVVLAGLTEVWAALVYHIYRKINKFVTVKYQNQILRMKQNLKDLVEQVEF